MKYPYKKGQKVKCLKTDSSPTPSIIKGEIYTINGINENNTVYIKDVFIPEDIQNDFIEPYFEVGDTIKILGKTTGYKFSVTELNKNKKYKIDDKTLLGNNVIEGWVFNPKDLEWIPENKEKEKKEMPKYKLIRPFNAADIKKAQGNVNCGEFKTEYIKYLEVHGYNKIISNDYEFDEFLEWASEKQIEFGIKHGFIERVEDKKYKIEVELIEDEFNYLMNCINISDKDYDKFTGKDVYGVSPTTDFEKNKLEKAGNDVWEKFDYIYNKYFS